MVQVRHKVGLLLLIMHPKNIIKPNHQTATRPATNLLTNNLYLNEEVFQTKLQQTLAKGSCVSYHNIW
jgi:hypothetical protein